MSERRRRASDREVGFIRISYPREGGAGYDVYVPEPLANQLNLPALQAHPHGPKAFAEHWAWWSENFLGRLHSRDDFEQRVRDYLLPSLGGLTEPEITPDLLRALFRGIEEKVSPQTHNHIRNHGHKIVADLIEEGRWSRSNPFARVAKLEVEAREPYMPSPAELERFLGALLAKNQPLAVVAIGFPSRIGELRSIRVVEVDLENRRLSIRRSGNENRRGTKTGGQRANIPYADWLHPFLGRAVALANEKGSEWLFSNTKGGQLSRNYKGANLVRRAFVRAGIPRAAELTFHDLRHVAITRLQEAGCHPGVVSLVAGHGKRRRGNTTQRVYTHFSEDFIRSELNKFALQVEPKSPGRKGGGSGGSSGTPPVRGNTMSPVGASSSAGQSTGLLSRCPPTLLTVESRPESPFPLSSAILAAVADRFWSKVDKSGKCWLWTGAVDGDGYGSVNLAKRRLTAHRVALELDGRLLAPGEVIRHSCNRPRCVNPAHLSIGSHADNRADCANSGRHAKGEQHGKAKLTEAQVREIRVLWRTVGVAELARRFGVSQRAVRFAAEGKNWRHLNGGPAHG